MPRPRSAGRRRDARPTQGAPPDGVRSAGAAADGGVPLGWARAERVAGPLAAAALARAGAGPESRGDAAAGVVVVVGGGAAPQGRPAPPLLLVPQVAPVAVRPVALQVDGPVGERPARVAGAAGRRPRPAAGPTADGPQTVDVAAPLAQVGAARLAEPAHRGAVADPQPRRGGGDGVAAERRRAPRVAIDVAPRTLPLAVAGELRVARALDGRALAARPRARPAARGAACLRRRGEPDPDGGAAGQAVGELVRRRASPLETEPREQPVILRWDADQPRLDDRTRAGSIPSFTRYLATPEWCSTLDIQYLHCKSSLYKLKLLIIFNEWISHGE